MRRFLSVLAGIAIAVLASRAPAAKAGNAGIPVAASQPGPLIVGLACEGSTSPLRELHGWDPRVPMTASPEQCMDAHTKRRIIPRSVALEHNPATESLGVVLTMSEPDRRSINDLFTAALMSGKRRDLILVDGKVVVSRNVASVISGPTLLLGMRSDDDARAVAAVLSGR